jgi:hypothetical protein
MLIKDLSDAGIDGANLNDLRDTLKFLRDKIYALRNNNVYHITNDGKTRNALDGTYIPTTQMLENYLDEFLELIKTKLKA